MASRFLLFVTLFAGLLAIAGCEQQTAAQKADADAKKTVAELLVGKWKGVKNPRRPEGFEVIEEYRSDGTVTQWMKNPGDHHFPQLRVAIGTYRLEGNLLFLSLHRREGETKITIDEITDDKLVCSGWDGPDLQTWVHERLR